MAGEVAALDERTTTSTSTVKTGRFAMIEQFLADGIDTMFGNPGTVEQGFLDALETYPDFHYVLTLQETIALAAADGYARATKRPAVVQLHTGVGLGNAVGMLYQAMRGHAPLLVVAGDAGVRYDAMDAQMAADLVGIAKPVTKWSTRVTDPASLRRVLRRAVKIAATPPTGPVFVALPMDVLDAPNDEPLVRSVSLDTRVAPADAQVGEMARVLASAERPIIFMGDGVAFSGAQAELARVAELVGAEVWGVDASEVNMAADHPLYQGLTGHMFGEHSRAISQRADVALVCGTYLFPEVFPSLEDVFAPGAKVVHIDLNSYEIAKNFPVDIGVVADPKLTLGRLADALGSVLTDAQKEAAEARTRALAETQAQERAAQLDADQAVAGETPLHASSFMAELAKHLPEDAMVFDEALTSSPELTRYVRPNLPGHYFQTRGGSLGVGIPGAIGMKLAHPDKTVVGFAGDGGSMYTIQALWTAAHHGVAAKFVICNNRSYKLLKLNVMQYWQERGIEEHTFPRSFDLSDPAIRFDTLAESLGVAAARVETPDEIVPAIEQMLAHDGPFLIDLVITDEVPGAKVGVKCGQ